MPTDLGVKADVSAQPHAEEPSVGEAKSEQAKLVRRAGVVGAGTLVSRILGLGRDMALAGVFGRAETDAFFVAFTIPNALRQLLAEGAGQSALVPVLTKTLAQDGEAAARRFFARARGASTGCPDGGHGRRCPCRAPAHGPLRPRLRGDPPASSSAPRS